VGELPLTAVGGRGHAILVGLPGAGKSTVGRRVARRLGVSFLDFDREIERRQASTVAAIFAERGEAHYRSLELDLTRELAGTAGMILSPGGGWIAVPAAVELLRPPGKLIYLKISPELALRRMGQGRSRRPLLQTPVPLTTLRNILAAREPLFLTADHIVDVDSLRPRAVIDTVADIASSV